jgi:hypothetical protein
MVGELDGTVIELNQAAYQQMTCNKALKIIPGASHLFEGGWLLSASCNTSRSLV